MANSRGADDDPFVILGVSRDCTPSELKRAYRLLALRYHPDVNPGREAAAQMSRINLAYSRALRQVERAARIRSVQTSTAGAVSPIPHAPPAPMRPTTRAGAAAPLRQEAERGWWRGLWITVAAGLGIGALILLGILYALDTTPRTPRHEAPQTSNPATLQLGGATLVNWRDTGNITLTERLLARFTPGMRLVEPPQWSPDGAYVAISVAPASTTPNRPNMPATTLLLQGSRLVTTLLATRARWSPVADQLAILTEPGASGSSQLELISPADLHNPALLDSHAGTHLAWSTDGQQIAYDANGQQQLRLVSIARGSPLTLMRAPGQRLIPLGWQNGQIVEIVHTGSAVSLVTVDPLRGLPVTLGHLDAKATGTSIAISRNSIAYVTQDSGAPRITLYWGTPHRQRETSIQSIQSVRFLAGWSDDETWMALAPVPSGAQTSEMCLAPALQATAPPATPWAVDCLLLPGTLVGISWEPHPTILSYVRMAEPGSALELRELRIQPAQALLSGHTIHATRNPALASLGPLALAVCGVWWECGSRAAHGDRWPGRRRGRAALLTFEGDP